MRISLRHRGGLAIAAGVAALALAGGVPALASARPARPGRPRRAATCS